MVEGMAMDDRDLRYARSQAEITRVRQGWVMIALNALTLAGTIVLLIERL